MAETKTLDVTENTAAFGRYDRSRDRSIESIGSVGSVLGSSRNFGETRFGRFATFDFLTLKTKNSGKFSQFFTVFRDFRPILSRFLIFRRQNQLLHQILLQIHPSWGLYDQKSVRSVRYSIRFDRYCVRGSWSTALTTLSCCSHFLSFSFSSVVLAQGFKSMRFVSLFSD